ncbi:translation initiation factor 2, alpha subunit [Guillardia theta CCMP2712]|uniref:Translation initiation factor 2, alpha subunit n=2 Tax=Guillardia theta TaxID=55529 RepID=L1JZ56_GUITC|nr:translation initiation factor 2, alpha subunit [Guillardia theta CCMP2712]EKX53378.1 translation initiation factor 2, alpha subunit [Guillardia theta CCMP2712]|eukprot:XP_005840358.1 translation initiation factor 2, alpha subunit [Guillardia theta CCMP2712]
MARYAAKLMDDGSITVDAPTSAFPPSGFFTLFHPKKEGCKPYSFHKYVEQAPYTKDHFAIKKEEENANWTCLIAATGKDGEVLDDRKFSLPHLGLPSLGKKGLSVYPDRDGNDRKSLGVGFPTDKEILDTVFVVPGLEIPLSATPEEPNLRCRMYRNKYPDVEETVVVLVKRIDVMGVYVSLVEYDDTEGMILLSELSRRRIRSVKKLINVGRQEVALVLRVDKDKGYIDLSKRRVSPEDVEKIEEKFNKSKSAHSIMRNLATTQKRDVEDLYDSFGWELGEECGHLLDAFKRLLSDPTILDKYCMSEDVKKALLRNVEMRLTPQPVKVRSDFEVTCFAYEGIDAIKAALLEGVKCGTEMNPISVRLIAPPLYVMTCNTLDQDVGIKLLEGALEKVKDEIIKRNGEMAIKMKPTAVGAEEEAALAKALEDAQRANMEVEGDDDEEEDED